jgi:NAD+ synthase (glutamine-hydrolysing)
MEDFKIGLAQINPIVGDLTGNTEKIISFIEKAKRRKAHLVVFPELAVTGYPPKDLLLKKEFIEKNKQKLEQIRLHTHDVAAIVGFVDAVSSSKKNIYDVSAVPFKKSLYNAAALIKNKEIIGVQYKTHLPSYDVFDEKRYFQPADKVHVFTIDGLRLGINICEDIWVDDGPTCQQVSKGAELIVNISASPFYAGKSKLRRQLIVQRVKENKVPIVYLNLVGGQDDLVYDGRSYLFNRKGKLIARCRQFEEDLAIAGLEGKEIPQKNGIYEEIHDALALGIRDYVKKNGFSKVVIGLSGGIDSSVVAALAVKALGQENVIGISMPSNITSPSSNEDAKQLADRLGIRFEIIPIKSIYDSYIATLRNEFRKEKPDVTEENLQARIRGNILMALSNKFGWLVLSCGNKSEISIGYVTIYGDMAGGLAVISDVPKTMVYKLAQHINRESKVIPSRILTKAPSAELREGQKDVDDIPPYDVLDSILHAYIEENKNREEIIAQGFDPKIVQDIIWRVDHNEYKRQQSPIGIKITPRAFGFGRRMPIVNKYH